MIGKLLLVVDAFSVCFCFCMKMPRVCGSHVLDAGSPEEKPGLAKLPRASVQAVTSPTNCHARYRPALDQIATLLLQQPTNIARHNPDRDKKQQQQNLCKIVVSKLWMVNRCKCQCKAPKAPYQVNTLSLLVQHIATLYFSVLCFNQT